MMPGEQNASTYTTDLPYVAMHIAYAWRKLEERTPCTDDALIRHLDNNRPLLYIISSKHVRSNDLFMLYRNKLQEQTYIHLLLRSAFLTSSVCLISLYIQIASHT